jgi:hypothetical protein
MGFEERLVFGMKAGEGARGGGGFGSPEGGEGEKPGEETGADDGPGEAGFVLDSERSEGLKDPGGEKAGPLAEGAAGAGRGVDFGVADAAGGGAALENEAVGGGEGGEKLS